MTPGCRRAATLQDAAARGWRSVELSSCAHIPTAPSEGCHPGAWSAAQAHKEDGKHTQVSLFGLQ